MKKLAMIVIAAGILAGLSFVWNAVLADAPLPPKLGQPALTPAPPVEPESLIHPVAPLLAVAKVPERMPAEASVAESLEQDPIHAQQKRQHTQLSLQVAKHLGVTSLVHSNISERTLSPSESEVCEDVIANSAMDIVKTGPTTGTLDSWSILWPKVYYDDRVGYYSSPSYSVVVGDDADTASYTSTFDYDEFGQAFRTPSRLTVITVTYSRLYTNTNSNDVAYGNLWTVTSQGDEDKLITWWPIGESPTGWSNRRVVITDSATLATLSNRIVALTYDMFTNRQSPYEYVWLDDAQVRLCHTTGSRMLYLPSIMRQPVQAGPTCTPYEPDNRDRRGSTMINAVCEGAFGPTDGKDYYTLDPKGISNIRLRLYNLPPEGNDWDALIYEYPYTGQLPTCQIGVPGTDKSVNCTLSLAKTYFVLVSTGQTPSQYKEYFMSVTPQ